MNRLYLANPDTPVMAPEAHALSDLILQKSAASAKRMLWMADRGDAIVTPTRISPAFHSYVADLKGRPNDVTASVHTAGTGPRPQPVAGIDARTHAEVAPFLRGLSDSLTHVEPYIADDVAWAFAGALSNGMVSFGAHNQPASARVTADLNDKAKFREIAGRLGVPIAPGRTCRGPVALVDAVRTYLDTTGTMILKMARHSEAAGNHVVTTTPARSFVGAASVTRLVSAEQSNVRRCLTDIGITASPEEPVVAEVYYGNAASLGVHFDVSPDHTKLLGVAEIVLNPTFGGSYWSRSTTDNVPAHVIEWSQTLANDCGTYGHIGPLSVDIVQDQSGAFFATEINGRHGGFSMIRAVARAIDAESSVEAGEVALLARNGLPASLHLAELLAGFRTAGLRYRRTSQSGIIVMSEGTHSAGPYSFVIVGSDRGEAMSLEARLLDLLR